MPHLNLKKAALKFHVGSERQNERAEIAKTRAPNLLTTEPKASVPKILTTEPKTSVPNFKLQNIINTESKTQ